VTDILAQANAQTGSITFWAEPTRLQCSVFAGTLIALCGLRMCLNRALQRRLFLKAVSRNRDNSSYAAIASFILHHLDSHSDNQAFLGTSLLRRYSFAFCACTLTMISLLSTLGAAIYVGRTINHRLSQGQ
jgi:hypothetical protein